MRDFRGTIRSMPDVPPLPRQGTASPAPLFPKRSLDSALANAMCKFLAPPPVARRGREAGDTPAPPPRGCKPLGTLLQNNLHIGLTKSKQMSIVAHRMTKGRYCQGFSPKDTSSSKLAEVLYFLMRSLQVKRKACRS